MFYISYTHLMDKSYILYLISWDIFTSNLFWFGLSVTSYCLLSCFSGNPFTLLSLMNQRLYVLFCIIDGSVKNFWKWCLSTDVSSSSIPRKTLSDTSSYTFRETSYFLLIPTSLFRGLEDVCIISFKIIFFIICIDIISKILLRTVND